MKFWIILFAAVLIVGWVMTLVDKRKIKQRLPALKDDINNIIDEIEPLEKSIGAYESNHPEILKFREGQNGPL